MNPDEQIEEQETQATPDLGSAIENFSDNLTGLRDFVKLVGSLLDDRQKATLKTRRRYLRAIVFAMDALEAPKNTESIDDIDQIRSEYKDKIKVERDADKNVKIEISDADIGKGMVEFIDEFRSGNRHQKLLYRSALISLISAAEWFLAQIFRQYFQSHPEASGIRDKLLSLEDLNNIGSINEAKAYLIDVRIDELMRCSITDWLEFLTGKVKLSAGYLTPNRDDLIEVFLRRNLMVHNDGVVNSTYAGRVPLNRREGVKIGDEMSVSPEYLARAIDLVEKIFILIAAELWKQLDLKDEERAEVLTKVAFDRIKQERYAVAEGLSFFTYKDKNVSERYQLIGQLNYWQTLKWQGRLEEIRKEIEDADFSAKDGLYQVARLTLLGRFDDVFDAIPNLLRAEKITVEQLQDWPIFREVRTDARFNTIVEPFASEATGTVQ